MYKFRTMSKDAHENIRNDASLKSVYEKQKQNGGKLRVDEDPRITGVGKILRKWDLDELPQLFNVLRGEMSMVGPRPYFKEELERYDVDPIFSVRPGVTGLWQVSGRNDLPFERRIKIDIKYANEVSFWTDLKVMLKTPYVVLFRIGAW